MSISVLVNTVVIKVVEIESKSKDQGFTYLGTPPSPHQLKIRIPALAKILFIPPLEKSSCSTPPTKFLFSSSKVYCPIQITIFILESQIAEMVVHKTIIKLFHFDLNLQHKSCSLPPLEWNMKGCTTSTHTHTYRSLFLLTMLLFSLSNV